MSDTGELTWLNADRKQGLVTIETGRTEGLIGFVKASARPLAHMTAEVQNHFCSVLLTSLDGKPIASSSQLLLAATARTTNTGLAWKQDHQTIADWGTGPVVTEPVTGKVTLRGLVGARRIGVQALSAVGAPIDGEVPVDESAGQWSIRVGSPMTTWYRIEVRR